MPIHNVPTKTAGDGAKKLRRLARAHLLTTRSTLVAMKAVVQTHGRSALAAELGSSDAQDLQQIYNAMKQFVADNDPALDDVGELPS